MTSESSTGNMQKYNNYKEQFKRFLAKGAISNGQDLPALKRQI